MTLLTNINIDRAIRPCEIRVVSPRIPATTNRAPVIPFPDFDENRRIIIECFQAVEGRGDGKVLPALMNAYKRLCHVRNSSRHARLAEFLHHAITAVESNQTEGAKYILLTALATFGWPSDYVSGS
jgi:hypothetical protein